MKTILAWFGYHKIPKEAVRLAMRIEAEHRWVYEQMPDDAYAIRMYGIAQTITEFLRSGRM